MEPGSIDTDWREDCAPRRTMEIFATKWTSMILHTLHALHGGEARTGVLQRSLPGISKKMLTQTLRGLERDGLVTRTIYPEIPPRVEYELTDLGRSLQAPLRGLEEWATEHTDEVLAARAVVDASGGADGTDPR